MVTSNDGGEKQLSRLVLYIYEERKRKTCSTQPQSNNVWLTSQVSNQQLMVFQQALLNQLPPVGAKYQIQSSGMDSIASPYSPDTEHSSFVNLVAVAGLFLVGGEISGIHI